MRTSRLQRGVTLIEALVALLVMAVGLIGIAGVQATLRNNGDVSKQRSEAVRLAQRAIESLRAFGQVQTDADPDIKTYDGIPDTRTESVAGVNATYSIAVTAGSAPVAGMKSVDVVVTWTDRAGATQRVTLNTSVARVAPEFAGTLAIAPPHGGERRPFARHAAIPRSAVDQGDGTSHFQPPGGGTLRWVFNNTTGAIAQICDPVPTCLDFNARFLSGSIAFATALTQPTAEMAEVPPSPAIAGLEVSVAQTYPSSLTVACFESTSSSYVEYFCAVPVSGSDTPPRWSGQSLVSGAIALAANAADPTGSAFRVCRYTPARVQFAVGDQYEVTLWNRTESEYESEEPDPDNPGSTRPIRRVLTNQDHPQTYTDVSTALVGQNFLVIRAGDGSSAFTCPVDERYVDPRPVAPDSPDIDGTTHAHQPAA